MIEGVGRKSVVQVPAMRVMMGSWLLRGTTRASKKKKRRKGNANQKVRL
jgi:hypothetical protein